MPRIIDYPHVTEQLARMDGLQCLYHNSGSFGFSPESGGAVRISGWVGPDDPSIRQAAMPHVLRIAPPYAENLARFFVRIWASALKSHEMWLMPSSHWAYELEFGQPDWLPDALDATGVAPAALRTRTDGSAIAFTHDECEPARDLIETLLTRLHGSDFTIAFPMGETLALLHHHTQIWWQTTRPEVASALTSVLMPSTSYE